MVGSGDAAWHLVRLVGVALAHIISHQLLFSVAGVALGDIDLGLAWQAWHLWFWAGSGGALGCHPGRRGTLRCRRGTCSHQPLFCVAGVALAHIDISAAGVALGEIDLGFAAALCVAGVAVAFAQTHIHVAFAWQAWRLATSTLVLRGRRRFPR